MNFNLLFLMLYLAMTFAQTADGMQPHLKTISKINNQKFNKNLGSKRKYSSYLNKPVVAIEKIENKYSLIFSMPKEKNPFFTIPPQISNQLKNQFLESPFSLLKVCDEAYLDYFERIKEVLEIRVELVSLLQIYDYEKCPVYSSRISDLEKIYRNKFRELLEDFVDKNQQKPLSFLNECTSPTCPLARRPNIRECPRHEIVEKALASLPENESIKNIMFYASGLCFMEMELIVHFLEQGMNIGDIILIDPYFEAMINYLTYYLPDDGEIDFNFILEFLSPRHTVPLLQIIQMLYFLDSLNHEARIFVYPYLGNYQASNGPRPSIVTAIDYLDLNCDLSTEDKLEPDLNEIFRIIETSGIMITAKNAVLGDEVLPQIKIINKDLFKN